MSIFGVKKQMASEDIETLTMDVGNLNKKIKLFTDLEQRISEVQQSVNDLLRGIDKINQITSLNFEEIWKAFEEDTENMFRIFIELKDFGSRLEPVLRDSPN